MIDDFLEHLIWKLACLTHPIVVSKYVETSLIISQIDIFKDILHAKSLLV